MSKAAQHKSEVLHQMLMYFFVLLILLLTTLNIRSYFKENKVLGASTVNVQQNNEDKFWGNFLSQNPNYIPGWIEMGKSDKVKQIDPNY